jgi:hypothetical protein
LPKSSPTAILKPSLPSCDCDLRELRVAVAGDDVLQVVFLCQVEPGRGDQLLRLRQVVLGPGVVHLLLREGLGCKGWRDNAAYLAFAKVHQLDHLLAVERIGDRLGDARVLPLSIATGLHQPDGAPVELVHVNVFAVLGLELLALELVAGVDAVDLLGGEGSERGGLFLDQRTRTLPGTVRPLCATCRSVCTMFVPFSWLTNS